MNELLFNLCSKLESNVYINNQSYATGRRRSTVTTEAPVTVRVRGDPDHVDDYQAIWIHFSYECLQQASPSSLHRRTTFDRDASTFTSKEIPFDEDCPWRDLRPLTAYGRRAAKIPALVLSSRTDTVFGWVVKGMTIAYIQQDTRDECLSRENLRDGRSRDRRSHKNPFTLEKGKALSRLNEYKIHEGS